MHKIYICRTANLWMGEKRVQIGKMIAFLCFYLQVVLFAVSFNLFIHQPHFC